MIFYFPSETGQEMAVYTFKIRRSFLLPLGLIVLLGVILLGSAIYLQLPTAKVVILAAFIVPAAIIFSESLTRQVSVDHDGVEVKKLLRSKNLKFSELTALDTIRVRKRTFISLSSEDDFIIISNSYANFGSLLQLLVAEAPENIVSSETRQLAADPPQKGSDIFAAWLAVAVLALIIYVQLKGAF